MAFRADEQAEDNRKRAVDYFIKNLPQQDRLPSETRLGEIIDALGPVVDSYPTWHPLVTAAAPRLFYPAHHYISKPGERCGYQGLDHTIYLANGFITCPYDDSGNQEWLFKSVEALQHKHSVVEITADLLGFPLYMPKATPILVKCLWHRPLASDGTIPKSLAVPLLLENELPAWKNFSDQRCAETWDTLRSSFLGLPCGSRSSLFVNQETGQALKNLWNTLIQTGTFGPIMPT